ncbi:MAG TPA: endonuclease [Tenuifilaceae bacterium]|nr:endonuclease [Tenuifilaceae bacterium]HPE17048.1 endonuclease [Tenuifilaceae bacterium]HPJ44667.1 endonuclease [Tenuifilaceae bacterium]HPQ32931.1 endonuclease [Tenuifilaceae bacterium]HRX66749.1 endonuclease [Tenuifilaceae bacterium]
MKKWILSILILTSITCCGQIPDGYYSSAQGKTGEQLIVTLSSIIDNHTEISYTELWSAFYETDKRDDGKVWDMYSTCSFTFGSDQDNGTGGTSECEYYNREHSFPRSWFGGAVAPMNTDLFHLYPTDKKVNSVRSDYPYGNVSSASYTSSNGCKLGNSVAGFSGTVFEPADDYKGDFARSYFYMATRYYSQINSWNSEMLNGSKFPAFAGWALDVLLEWHQSDPVSTKEIERNNTIYKNFQHNRNPFIDQPNLVQKAWEQGSSPLEFTSTPNTTAYIENNYTYQVDVNASSSSSVTFTCLIKPDWITLSNRDSNSAMLEGTPNENDLGYNYVVILANNGNSHAIQQFEINVKANGTGLTPLNPTELSVFPNPASSDVFISMPCSEKGVITLYSTTGTVTKSFSASGNTAKLNVSDLPAGIYILVYSNSEKNLTILLNIQK